MKRHTTLILTLIAASIALFFVLNLVLGSVAIPLRSIVHILFGTGEESEVWRNIVWKSRVPQSLTALVAGAGLAVSGLQMQTVFRNPLAGPSVLGISSGASLGVALVILFVTKTVPLIILPIYVLVMLQSVIVTVCCSKALHHSHEK